MIVMEKKIFALVITAMMLGSLVVLNGYTPVVQAPIQLGEVKIGVITAVPDLTDLAKYQILLGQLAANDINKNLKMKGVTAQFTFDIRAGSYPDRDAIFTSVQELHNQGTDLIIGGFYSGQAMHSLAFVHANNMLMISPMSTSPSLEIANDGLYRMCPSDSFVTIALADMLVSSQIDSIIILERFDHMNYQVDMGFAAVNKVPVISTIGYDGFGDPTLMDAEYDRVLQMAENDARTAINAGKKVAIVLLAYGEVNLIKKIPNYSTLYNLNWFDGNNYGPSNSAQALQESAKIHLYRPVQTIPPETLTRFNALQERYRAIAGNDKFLNWYDAATYDIAWVIAESVLTAKSKDTSNVIEVLPQVSSNYAGVSGVCKLNASGDRANPYYEIVGYYVKDPSTNPPIVDSKTYGYCDYNAKRFVWYTLP